MNEERRFQRDREIMDRRSIDRNLSSDNRSAQSYGRLQEIAKPALDQWAKAEQAAGSSAIHSADALLGFALSSIAQILIQSGMTKAERIRVFAWLITRIPGRIECYERQLTRLFAAEQEFPPEAVAAVNLPEFLKGGEGQ